MKRLFTLLPAVLLAITTTSQTITVTNDDGSTNQISAATAGTMMYNQTDGTLTIGGEAYQVVNIDIHGECRYCHQPCGWDDRGCQTTLSLLPQQLWQEDDIERDGQRGLEQHVRE